MRAPKSQWMGYKNIYTALVYYLNQESEFALIFFFAGYIKRQVFLQWANVQKILIRIKIKN